MDQAKIVEEWSSSIVMIITLIMDHTYILVYSGALFVTTIGTKLMPQLCAVLWVIEPPVQLHMLGAPLELEVDQYGLEMLHVQAQNRIL